MNRLNLLQWVKSIKSKSFTWTSQAFKDVRPHHLDNDLMKEKWKEIQMRSFWSIYLEEKSNTNKFSLQKTSQSISNGLQKVANAVKVVVGSILSGVVSLIRWIKGVFVK